MRFPQVPSHLSSLTINMEEVTRLNSNGARAWMVWVSGIPSTLPVYLEECPVIVIKSFSLIKGVFLPNMDVLSFYVPFCSDETGERTNVLLEKGKHYFEDGNVKLPTITDAKGEPMEIDVIAEAYFSFLKR